MLANVVTAEDFVLDELGVMQEVEDYPSKCSMLCRLGEKLLEDLPVGDRQLGRLDCRTYFEKFLGDGRLLSTGVESAAKLLREVRQDEFNEVGVFFL